MYQFIFIILALLSFFTSFNNGLYFFEDYWSVSLIIYFLFFIWLLRIILYKEIASVRYSLIILLLPLCYLLSFPTSQSYQGSWTMLIKWTSYSAFFIMISWTASNKNLQKWFPIVFQSLGILIAFHMIFVDIGWLNSLSIKVAGRFGGVFQYPNTFALSMAVFILFSLILFLKSSNTKLETIFYLFPLPFFFANFFLAFSKGIFIIFPVFWFIGLLLLKPQKRVQYLLLSLLTSGGALLTIIYCLNNSQGLTIMAFSLLMLLAFAIVILNLFGINPLFKKASNAPRFIHLFNQFGLPLMILILSGLVFLDLKYEGLIYNQLSKDQQKQLNSISLQSDTAFERLLFYQDALQMSKDSPLLGHGGNSWATSYKNYQQTPYISNKIHNGYLEWVVDNGWIGLLLFVAVFGLLIYQRLKGFNFKSPSTVNIAVLLSLGLIFTHSLIDFNFSFGTIWLMTFWLFAIIQPTIADKQTDFSSQKSIFQTICLMLFSAVIIVTSYMVIQFQSAEELFNNKDPVALNAKIETLETVTKKNPYNIKYSIALGNLYLSNPTSKNIHLATTIAEELPKMEDNNADLWIQSALLLNQLGNTDQMLNHLDQALKSDRFNAHLYELLIASNIEQANASYNKEYFQDAIDYFEEMIKTYREFELKNLDAAFNSRDFHITNKAKTDAMLANLIIEEYQVTLEIYTEVSNSGDYKTEIIAAYAFEALGDTQQASDIFNRFNDPQSFSYKKSLDELQEKFN